MSVYRTNEKGSISFGTGFAFYRLKVVKGENQKEYTEIQSHSSLTLHSIAIANFQQKGTDRISRKHLLACSFNTVHPLYCGLRLDTDESDVRPAKNKFESLVGVGPKPLGIQIVL